MRRTVALLAGVLLVAGGCGKKLVPVEGVVTLDGKPVPGAEVNCIPLSGGFPAIAETDDQGVFRIATTNQGQGVTPGEYRVMITCEEPPPPMFRTSPNESGEDIKKKMTAELEKRKKSKRAAVTIPAVYGDQGRSPLILKVPPEGKVEFKLDSKAK